ncbi:MAG: hypothetical protein FJW95_08195 [Actinobacteria bacterium]|nr:hypothetical protein [Actinomycetota bacterium]
MSTPAPTPGVGRRVEAAAQAPTTMTIRVRDQRYTIVPNNIPMKIMDRFELETGRTVEYVTTTRTAIGELQIALLCYLATLIAGEQGRWAKFRDAWPEDLAEGDVEVTVDEDGDDSPEA